MATILVGWREWAALPALGLPRVRAKLDTGARSSALHVERQWRFVDAGTPWVGFALLPRMRGDLVELSCAPVHGENDHLRMTIRPAVRELDPRPVVTGGAGRELDLQRLGLGHRVEVRSSMIGTWPRCGDGGRTLDPVNDQRLARCHVDHGRQRDGRDVAPSDDVLTHIQMIDVILEPHGLWLGRQAVHAHAHLDVRGDQDARLLLMAIIPPVGEHDGSLDATGLAWIELQAKRRRRFEWTQRDVGCGAGPGRGERRGARTRERHGGGLGVVIVDRRQRDVPGLRRRGE